MSTNTRGLHSAFLIYACLVISTAIIGMPFLWMLVTSLKSTPELIQYPPTWWPHDPQPQNYVEAWNAAPFARFYLNSFITATAATAIQISAAALMAYAFVMLSFPFKGVLFVSILATMMVPEEMKLIPNYLLLSKLNWIDTYWALIIPPAAHAFPVFVLHEHFRSLPKSLVEVARLEGASHLRILVSVLLPMSRPIIAAVALVAFAARWNDYLWPLIVTNSESMRTLPVGLAYLKDSQEGGIRWNLLMAGTIFVIMPLLTLFWVAQRYFVAGLMKGALKY